MKSRSDRWRDPRGVMPANPAGIVLHAPGMLNASPSIDNPHAVVARGRYRHWLRCLDCGRTFPGECSGRAYEHCRDKGHRLAEVTIEEVARVDRRDDPATWFPEPHGGEPLYFQNGEGE